MYAPFAKSATVNEVLRIKKRDLLKLSSVTVVKSMKRFPNTIRKPRTTTNATNVEANALLLRIVTTHKKISEPQRRKEKQEITKT